MRAKEKDFFLARFSVFMCGRKPRKSWTRNSGKATDGVPRLSVLFLFALSVGLVGCRIDPTGKELITHVPVIFDLIADRSLSPEDFNLGNYFEVERDTYFAGEVAGQFRTQNLSIMPASPSNPNFLDASVASFEVVASNGARYTWSLRGAAIQRQYDRIALNIPNMPVGPANFNGLVFLNPGGVPN